MTRSNIPIRHEKLSLVCKSARVGVSYLGLSSKKQNQWTACSSFLVVWFCDQALGGVCALVLYIMGLELERDTTTSEKPHRNKSRRCGAQTTAAWSAPDSDKIVKTPRKVDNTSPIENCSERLKTKCPSGEWVFACFGNAICKSPQYISTMWCVEGTVEVVNESRGAWPAILLHFNITRVPFDT